VNPGYCEKVKLLAYHLEQCFSTSGLRSSFRWAAKCSEIT